MPRSVNGLRVAITGGAQGIGYSIAEALVAGGAKVAIGDVQRDAADRAADQLGSGAVAFHLDVSDADSFATFLGQCEQALGGLDALVNNAGIMPIGPYLEENDNLTRRTIDIDLMGVLVGTKLAGQLFHAQGRGHVVNIASVMGTLASPNAATYCAAKFAVVGFSEALRQEWRGSGVNITAVCPGFVRTELIAGMSAPGPMERFVVVDPEDVARAVVRELGRQRSRTVFVPKTVGGVSRGASNMPPGVRDFAFRATGGDKVTTGLDLKERAAYQARAEGKV